jgi:hypothetical protein
MRARNLDAIEAIEFIAQQTGSDMERIEAMLVRAAMVAQSI